MAEPQDVVKQVKKAIRRRFSADEKIRIVLEGLRGEQIVGGDETALMLSRPYRAPWRL